MKTLLLFAAFVAYAAAQDGCEGGLWPGSICPEEGTYELVRDDSIQACALRCLEESRSV